ncbi:hypothetical protein ACKKBF_B17095 [Auxenochlorella protothecoides x Auxenochlorella symbiontica]
MSAGVPARRQRGKSFDLESQTPAFSSSVDSQWEGLRLEGEPAQLRLTPTHLEWMFPGGRPGWHSLPLCEVIGVRPVPEAARVPKATWWGGQAAPCPPTAHIHTFRRAPGRPWEWHPRVIPVSHFDDSRALDAWCHSLQQGVAAVSMSRPRSLLVIVNPVSGAGRAPALAHAVLLPVLRAAGVTCTVRATRRRNHTLALLHALSPAQLAAYDGIVAVGGDGAFHELVNALFSEHRAALRALRLAHVPAGSTDAVACSLHGCRSAFGAAARVALGYDGLLDVLRVDPGPGRAPVHACCIAAAGFMGEVCARAEAWRALGPLRYDLLGAAALLTGRGVRARVSTLPSPLTGMAAERLGPGAEGAACRAGCPVCELAGEGGGASASSDGDVWSESDPPLDTDARRVPSDASAGGPDALHRQGSPSALALDPVGPQPGTPPTKWESREGRWRSVKLIVTPCRSDKTPCGMARAGHLADGRVKVVLVPDLGALGMLRVLAHMAARGLAAGDLPGVEVLDARAVRVEGGRGATLDWNLDGEATPAALLRAHVIRGGLRVFARGVETGR